jgi:hypothetical protein
MKAHHNFDQPFEFAGRAKTLSIIGILIGVVGVIIGFAMGHAERTFANLLLMAYYFTCVCMEGVFFCALQYVSQSGWSAALLRIPQSFAKVLPVAATVLVVVIAASIFTTHNITNEEGKTVVAPFLYKDWAIKGVSIVGNENYNAGIAAKVGYLNKGFFFARIIGFLAFYSIMGALLVKYSRNEDSVGGMRNYNTSFNMSAFFLAIFGFTIPLFAFDVVMSLEAHWFSTMFGWYNFAGMWVSGLAAITLTIIILKQNGHFTWITENHLHDLGKLIFAFSIFWTYVWFGQFFLIWYANMPEETAYFYRRWEPEYKWWFWLNIVLNFACPVLIIMSRDAKRNLLTLKTLCIIVLLGHWLDYYLMIMPGTVGTERGFSIEEITIAIGFVGLFTFSVLTALSKFKSLVPKNHPFLEESLHHHI